MRLLSCLLVVLCLVAGCARSPERAEVPGDLEAVVRELVHAVDPSAEVRIDGVTCFDDESWEAGGDSGTRWTMRVPLAGDPDELANLVSRRGADLGWKAVGASSDVPVAVALDQQFSVSLDDAPVVVAVHPTERGVELLLHEQAAGDEGEACLEDAPLSTPFIPSDLLELSAAQRSALEGSGTAMADVVPRAVAALGPWTGDEPGEGTHIDCVVDGRPGAALYHGGDVEWHTTVDSKETLVAEVDKLSAALAPQWRVADRAEKFAEPGDWSGRDGVITVLYEAERSDQGVGASVRAEFVWANDGSRTTLTDLLSTCVPADDE